mmetsp:Transcript_1141/g.3155  ORF Transcript_1141/g.3155 Transcript_1141/m.3155 type:complete len:284 (-) Transcript_1141:337-1188(-)
MKYHNRLTYHVRDGQVHEELAEGVLERSLVQFSRKLLVNFSVKPCFTVRSRQRIVVPVLVISAIDEDRAGVRQRKGQDHRPNCHCLLSSPVCGVSTVTDVSIEQIHVVGRRTPEGSEDVHDILQMAVGVTEGDDLASRGYSNSHEALLSGKNAKGSPHQRQKIVRMNCRQMGLRIIQYFGSLRWCHDPVSDFLQMRPRIATVYGRHAPQFWSALRIWIHENVRRWLLLPMAEGVVLVKEEVATTFTNPTPHPVRKGPVTPQGFARPQHLSLPAQHTRFHQLFQ